MKYFHRNDNFSTYTRAATHGRRGCSGGNSAGLLDSDTDHVIQAAELYRNIRFDIFLEENILLQPRSRPGLPCNGSARMEGE
jgi:hypothetical protein